MLIFNYFSLVPSLSMRKVSQHRKMSIDSGVSGAGSSTSSNASINNGGSVSVSSGVMTPKGDATSSTLINLNNSSSAAKTGIEKGINDIRITENPISESPELTADPEAILNPVC